MKVMQGGSARRLSRLALLNPSQFTKAGFQFSSGGFKCAPLRGSIAVDCNDYAGLVHELFLINRTRYVKLGLDSMTDLGKAMGYGWIGEGLPIIHVAGTNGKGSVVTKTAQVLQDHGYRVGRFISPHVSSFRERMSVNGEHISEQQVCEILPQILRTAEKNQISATFFDFTTMLALRFFHMSNCDYVVLETGLGGRLDSTNVVDPAISIITSISLEHTAILGDTIPEITREKAGIIKPGKTDRLYARDSQQA